MSARGAAYQCEPLYAGNFDHLGDAHAAWVCMRAALLGLQTARVLHWCAHTSCYTPMRRVCTGVAISIRTVYGYVSVLARGAVHRLAPLHVETFGHSE